MPLSTIRIGLLALTMTLSLAACSQEEQVDQPAIIPDPPHSKY